MIPPEIYRETIRLSTSPFFIERVARKDGVEKPTKVPFEKINYVVTPELEDALGFNAELYRIALPIYVAEREFDQVGTYRVDLEMEEKIRDIEDPKTEKRKGLPVTFPHMTITVTRVFKDKDRVDEKVGEQSFELLFYDQSYPSYNDKHRPNFSIFRRRPEGSMAVIKTAIKLGFKNGDQNTHGMALILKEGYYNTRFVYTHDFEVKYSEEMAEMDEVTNGTQQENPEQNILDFRIYDKLS